MAELQWFPLYAQDFLTSESVLCMTPEQIGGYVTLLCVAWGDGTKPPSLPNDDRALSKLSRLGKRWAKGRDLIRAQFCLGEDGRLTNPRLAQVWQEQQDRHDKAVQRASAGGRAKAEHKQSTSTVQVCHIEREVEGERENTVAAVVAREDPSALPYAVQLTVAANQGVTARWGEQPIPFIATSAPSQRAAREVEAYGVPIAEACGIAFSLAKDSTQDRPPRALTYWTKAICDRWDAIQAQRAAAASPTPDVIAHPKISGAPRGTPGDAALLLARIRDLAETAETQGAGRRQFIRRARVAELGPPVLRAYEAIGGADRILATKPEHFGILTRDFAAALSAAGTAA